MLTEGLVMGSAGSARPEVTVVEAGSDSSEDPDFELGNAFHTLHVRPRLYSHSHSLPKTRRSTKC